MTISLPDSLWLYILESYITTRNKPTLAALSATNWHLRHLTLPLLFRNISLAAPLPQIPFLRDTIILNAENIVTRTKNIIQRVAKLWCNSQTSRHIRRLDILNWGVVQKEIEKVPFDISNKYGVTSAETYPIDLQRVCNELESTYQLILEEFAPALRLDTLIISDSKLNTSVINLIMANPKLRNISIINHTNTELDSSAIRFLSQPRIVSLELTSHGQYNDDPLLLRHIISNNQVPLLRLKTSLDIVSAIDQDTLSNTLSGLQSLIVTQSRPTLSNLYTLRRLLSISFTLRRLQIAGPLWKTSGMKSRWVDSDTMVDIQQCVSLLEESISYQLAYLESINIPINLIGILVPNKPIRSVSIQLLQGSGISDLRLLQSLQYSSAEIMQLELKKSQLDDIKLTRSSILEFAKYVPNITTLKLPVLDLVSGADPKDILEEMLVLAQYFPRVQQISLCSQDPEFVKFQERSSTVYEQRGHASLKIIEIRHVRTPAFAWLWFPDGGWTLVTLLE